jgi:hypothetical protein
MEFLEFLRLVNSQHIVGVVGDLGDGKSIVGVSVMSMLRTLSLATSTPLHVTSNIPLAYPHKFIEYYDELDDVHQSLIFVDEIHLIADSRNSQSGTNFFTSGVTVAVRKKKCKMLWTSQETSQVELRVKNRTTLFLNPTRINPDDNGDLRFKINIISKTKRLLGDITLDLAPYKDDYDTYYIPLPLIDREEDNKKKAKRKPKL